MVMRLKTKCRGSRDKVKEASRRLRGILNTSRRLGVDLGDLAVWRHQEHSGGWLLFSTICVGLLLAAVALVACSGLPDLLACPNNTTKDIEIPTMRLDRLALDGSSEGSEETSLFNDSEDTEDGHQWLPSTLRLRRER